MGAWFGWQHCKVLLPSFATRLVYHQGRRHPHAAALPTLPRAKTVRRRPQHEQETGAARAMGGTGSAHLEEHKFRLCLVVERRLGPENHVPRLTKPTAAAAADQHACCGIPALKLQQADDREREKPEHENRARQLLGPDSDNRAFRLLPRHLRRSCDCSTELGYK